MADMLGHPRLDRRRWLQAGGIGLLGLTLADVERLRAETPDHAGGRSVIFVFLSGGLAQHESFDPKPEASSEIRGEFDTIATRTPGYRICEHLPRLAACSQLWSAVRSLTHSFNEHSQGHMAMLSGRSDLPLGFDPNRPKETDHPSIAAIAGAMLPPRNNLPSAIVLPEKLIHRTGRVLPGQFAASMGPHRDPYFLDCVPYHPESYGAWPRYGFDHQNGPLDVRLKFRVPSLELPAELTPERFAARVDLLGEVQRRQRSLERLAETDSFDRFAGRALSMLADPEMAKVFRVDDADDRTLERYGRHAFGWSLLLSRRLVDAGATLVQVNLGNNETWDTHGNAFPHLRDLLLPPMDQAVSALIEGLEADGRLDETLVVVAGEFGRTPKISHLAQHYRLPGRDHWGRAQSILLAGGGIRGGRVIGATDAAGGEPIDTPVTPEHFAATIYRALGLPRQATWSDLLDRPMPVYHGDPIPGLT